jgi:hypothetical protein
MQSQLSRCTPSYAISLFFAASPCFQWLGVDVLMLIVALSSLVIANANDQGGDGASEALPAHAEAGGGGVRDDGRSQQRTADEVPPVGQSKGKGAAPLDLPCWFCAISAPLARALSLIHTSFLFLAPSRTHSLALSSSLVYTLPLSLTPLWSPAASTQVFPVVDMR